MTKKEFQKFWDRAAKTDFKLVALPSGAMLVGHPRHVFLVWTGRHGQVMLTAITREKETYGKDFALRSDFSSDPETWIIE